MGGSEVLMGFLTRKHRIDSVGYAVELRTNRPIDLL